MEYDDALLISFVVVSEDGHYHCITLYSFYIMAKLGLSMCNFSNDKSHEN